MSALGQTQTRVTMPINVCVVPEIGHLRPGGGRQHL